LKRAFNIITKPVGPICNLNCQYCFYLEKEKLYPGEKNWIMPEDVLESFIQQYIEIQDVKTIHFTWQGGEPTLPGLNYFKKAVEFQKKYSNGKKIENAFQTNGILLDDQWCEFFVTNNFLVGLSIDGPRYLHDQYRINKKGKSTFDYVLQASRFLKKHDVQFNTLTVVNRVNSYHSLEIYHFLKEVGSGFIQFIPAVEKKRLDEHTNLKRVSADTGYSAQVTEWSVEPVQYGNFLCQIFDEWVRNDVGTYFIQTFDVALERWYGMPSSLCIFAETCGTTLAMEHNGDLYSCDHYVFPENRLGNIKQQPVDLLVFSEQQIKFGLDKRNLLPDFCKKCEVKFACNGECPKNRFITTPDGESGLNYLCEGYKQFFHFIAPYMWFMAEELKQKRAPANVMKWARDRIGSQ
jgi:uncharacterized protein